ncbi:MAG TPA: hypothetical protein VND64_22560 [Pirellulales bacterium]|nr:hypothetical protein [Pirellulales bacterium]
MDTSLRLLDLTETIITDQGLATVAKLTQLEEWHLDWTNIGDAGHSAAIKMGKPARLTTKAQELAHG